LPAHFVNNVDRSIFAAIWANAQVSGYASLGNLSRLFFVQMLVNIDWQFYTGTHYFSERIRAMKRDIKRRALKSSVQQCLADERFCEK